MIYQVGGLTLFKRGSVYHIRGTHEGKRIRVSTGSGDLRLARLALDDLHAELESGWRADPEGFTLDISWAAVAKWIHARHKVSAKERGIPFDIAPADVYSAMQATGFRCAVSGIDFSRRVGPLADPDPWSPSLDRIEGRQGYLKGNIRVVCLVANLAMNRWGYDTLLRLSNAVSRNANHVVSEPEILTQNLDRNGQFSNEIN